MKIYLPILIAVLFLFTACEKEPQTDPPVETPELDLDIVTGIQMRDENGQAIGNAGNPNAKNGEITVFPNPLVDVANIFILDGYFDDIWILPGIQNKNFAELDFATVLENHKVTVKSITDNKIMDFGFPSDQNVKAAKLNVQNLETGYYRIFYKTKTGEIFWDNLKVDKAVDPNERITNLINEWK